MQDVVLRVFSSSICILIAGLTSAGSLLRADSPPPKEAGYHFVPIKQGDKVAYVKVQDSADPYKGVKDSSGDKEPDHFSFSKTSPMAHEKYDTGDTASSHDTGSYQKEVEHTFVTQSYFADAPQSETPNLHSSIPVKSAEGYSARASGFDKSFMTASADLDQNKTADGMTSTSSYQGRSAVLGGHEVKKFSSDMSDKSFTGRERDDAHRDLVKIEQGLAGIKDLPNRPLTIDEVRALVNHGVKPQTDEKPAEPSKALNDPDYMPDPAPAPLRASAADDHHLLDDNDIIPPPGMMAHPVPPENSEPLPP